MRHWIRKKFNRYPCEICGRCCRAFFSAVPFVLQEFPHILENSLRILNSIRGEDGHCIHFDFLENKCKIYKQRPWFCDGYEIWKEILQPLGVSLEQAHDIFEQQCASIRK